MNSDNHMGWVWPHADSVWASGKGKYNTVTHYGSVHVHRWFNTLRPRQDGRHFTDDTFKPIFMNENIRISIKISLKFVSKVPINNIPALIQIMAWRRLGDKPLSEPMMVYLLTYICVTRPQWVNSLPCWRSTFDVKKYNFQYCCTNCYLCIFLW